MTTLSAFTKLNTHQRCNLIALFAAGLLFWGSLASLLPTLPLYLSTIGSDSQQIGVVMGCFAIGLLAFRAGLSRLADERGRKLALLLGMAAVAIAPLGYLATDSIPLLIGVRAFHGLSIASFAVAYSALVVDISPPHQRGEVIGYMSLVNPIGMALGPALGGFLQGEFGFAPAFMVATVLGGGGLLCIALIREPPKAPQGKTAAKPAPAFWSLLASPRIRVPALVLLMAGLAFGTLATFLPLFVQEMGVVLNVGLFYTAAAIASFSIRLITGPASDRFGRGPFITLSLMLYTLAMFMLWRANSPSTLLVAGAIEGAGAGILIPMMAALMADRSTPDERGRTFSLCMVGFDMGIAIAGPLMGAIANVTDYRFVFGIVTGTCLLGLLIFLMLSSKNLGHSLRFATGQVADVYAIDPLLKPSVSSEKF